MSRILSACLGLFLCFHLGSSQPQDVNYWRLNFDRSPSQHAYTASFYAVSEASHFLAERYWRQQQRALALFYYQRAVDQGDAGAAYSLAQRIPAQREQWLKAAVELGEPRATLTVAEQLRATEPTAAMEMLQTLPRSVKRDEALASLLFNHPHLGSEAGLDWQALAPPTSRWHHRLIQARAFDREHGYNMPGHTQCTGKITFYYHGDRARSRAYDWLEKLARHPFAQLGVCFEEVEPTAGDHRCDRDRVGRARCEPAMDSKDGDLSVHVVSAGTANVRANHMAIAQTASFDIFIHELAHLFALADEYPMRAELAQAFCSGRYRFSPLNLLITPKDTAPLSYQRLVAMQESLPWKDYLEQAIAVPVLTHQGEIAYQLGSPSTDGVGLFKVATCAGTEFQAWRPVAGVTFMQQHEVGKVPEVYIQLIRSHLQAGLYSSAEG